MIKTVPAETITISLFKISFQFRIDLETIALTLCNITGLTLKTIVTAGTVFLFVLAHGIKV